MTMIEPQASPVGPLTAYGPTFAQIQNVKVSQPTNQQFVVTFQTDQSVICNLTWSAGPDIPYGTLTGATIIDAGPATNHTFTVNVGSAVYAGKHINFNIQLDPTDASGFFLRPQNYLGSAQLVGARAAAGNQQQAPVRFYNFGGTPPPPAHGGGSGTTYVGSGNWSTYAWGQYAPKRTAYPN